MNDDFPNITSDPGLLLRKEMSKSVIELANILNEPVLNQLDIEIAKLLRDTETVFLDFGKVSGIIHPAILLRIYNFFVTSETPHRHRVIIFNVAHGTVAKILRDYTIFYCEESSLSEVLCIN